MKQKTVLKTKFIQFSFLNLKLIVSRLILLIRYIVQQNYMDLIDNVF